MDMYQTIDKLARSIHEQSVADRRNMHQYPETGWFEMRTSPSSPTAYGAGI